jgi:Cu2+-exporting ATPase
VLHGEEWASTSPPAVGRRPIDPRAGAGVVAAVGVALVVSLAMRRFGELVVAQAQADAVFLGTGLSPVEAALDGSRVARRLMRQNLALAVLYNLIAVPLAVTGHVTPLVAALAMSGSSILVTLNALRAARFGRPVIAVPQDTTPQETMPQMTTPRAGAQEAAA